jgi:Glycosyl hydrolases family 16
MSGRPADDLDGFGLDEQWRHRGISDGDGGANARAVRRLVVAVATVLVVTLTVAAAALIRHISVSSVPNVLAAKPSARPGITWAAGGRGSDLSAGTGVTGPTASGVGGAGLSAAGLPGNVPGTTAPDTGGLLDPSAGTFFAAPSATAATGAASPKASAGPSATPSGTAPSGTAPSGTAPSSAAPSGSASAAPSSAAPSGGASAPSGAGVPGNLPGWQLTYSTNFPGNSLPSKWGAYSGQPGGDPDGNWNPANVAVSGGELHFYASNGSTGGVSFFGNPQTYGMYQVRMKGDSEPGINISDILLLWPASNVWPPEIDFFEDGGGDRSEFQATVHAGPDGDDSNQVHVGVNNNATQWHTYGVEWTPSTITFTVDGQSVGSVSQSDTGSWPNIPMNLDLQSQNLGPSQPANGTETMTVAWVAEYTAS